MKKLLIIAVLAAGCATTSKEATKGVSVAPPKEEGKTTSKAEKASPDDGQPRVSEHAKLLFEDANKAYEAQKKSGKYDYGALKRKYQEASAADPNLAEAEYDLGVIAEHEGHKDEAVQHYQAALKRKPTLKEAAENLAVIAQNQGQIKEAVRVYEEIVNNYPDDAGSRARLGAIYADQGDCEKGLELAKAALVRDPKSVPAYKVMARCYLAQNKLAMTKLILLRTIKLSENDPELYHLMGMALVKEKEPDKAMIQFKKALEVRPDYLPSHVVLARIALDKENFGEAEEHLRRMIQADSKNAGLHLDLGVVYKGRGDCDKALQEYDIAEKLSPDLSSTHFNRGIILLRCKQQWQAAIDEFKKFKLLANPKTEHPVFALEQEASQAIETDKQNKEAMKQAEEMERKAKEEEEKKKSQPPGTGAPAEDAAKQADKDKAAPPEGGEKPAGKTAPAKAGPDATKPEAKPAAVKPAAVKPAAEAKPAAPPPAEKPAPKKPSGEEPTDEPKE